MAVIYQFDAYRTPRLLSRFAQQTGDVAAMIHEQQGYLVELERAVGKLEDGLLETRDILHDAEEKLEDAHDAYDISEEALRLGTMEDLVAARDELIKRRRQSRI